MEAVKKEVTVISEVRVLEVLFDRLNEVFYGGELERPVITVAPGMKIRGGVNYGWCTGWRAWRKVEDGAGEAAALAVDSAAAGYYEINISADSLNRPMLDTIETMAHEMVHLYCALSDIKDTSRSGTYHNKRFKEAAEAHGLLVEESNSKNGWNTTAPGIELLAFAKEQDDLRLTICRTREVDLSAKPAKKPYKWQCPRCGVKMQSARRVVAQCGCEGLFADAEDEPEFVAFKCMFDPDEEEQDGKEG